jgi:hypothetical protein
LQVAAYRADGRQGGQALLGVVAVRVEVLRDQRFEQLESLRTQPALLGEDLSERRVFVLHPNVHGGDQGGLVDEARLQREDPE